jgi:hypothetical protein
MSTDLPELPGADSDRSASGDQPRQLTFSHLEQVMPEVDRLARDGYRPLGEWDLAQCCEHLRLWMQYPIDGYPPTPLPMQMMVAIMRWTVGRRWLGQILATRKMRAGGPTLPVSVPQAGQIDLPAAVDGLRRMIARVQQRPQERYRSPIFGELTHEQFVELHCVHAAHHLSFLVPGDRRPASP